MEDLLVPGLIVAMIVISILYFRGGTIFNKIFNGRKIEEARARLAWTTAAHTPLAPHEALAQVRREFSHLAKKPGALTPQTYVMESDEAIVGAYAARVAEWWRLIVVAVPSDDQPGTTTVIASMGDATFVDGVLPGLKELADLQERVGTCISRLPRRG